MKRGWRRVYLEHFMELIAGRKIDVVEFILDNLNSENQLTMSQAQV
ncbi:replication/maintenance protein RepL [Helicobacter cinaedi]|nr:replication/maintenance protein RepL [Helicobacter cinaedi]